MIRRNFSSPNTKGGGRYEMRLKGFGYTSKGYKVYMVGENIALGSGHFGAPEKSKGHRHNILKRVP